MIVDFLRFVRDDVRANPVRTLLTILIFGGSGAAVVEILRIVIRCKQ